MGSLSSAPHSSSLCFLLRTKTYTHDGATKSERANERVPFVSGAARSAPATRMPDSTISIWTVPLLLSDRNYKPLWAKVTVQDDGSEPRSKEFGGNDIMSSSYRSTGHQGTVMWSQLPRVHEIMFVRGVHAPTALWYPGAPFLFCRNGLDARKKKVSLRGYPRWL